MNDTIAACATALGRAGVAVIRVSGPLVPELVQQVVGKSLPPRQAVHGSFYAKNRDVLDMGIAIYFPAPHSFTGEDILELQGHGSPLVIDALLAALVEYGVRLARPGEFSERAFLNNKLDLSQAEAIADLIDSTSKTAARSALRSLQGVFSQQIDQFQATITALRVQVEAMIDFPDEDIETIAIQKVQHGTEALLELMQQITQQASQGALLRDGLSLVIMGEPNAGKSTLLNTLAQKPVAIVTELPGTTRDVMRERISLDELPLHIIDTAGIRDSDDVIEQEGIRRAWQEAQQADCVLMIFDARYPEQSMEHLMADLPDCPVILVANKIDLLTQPMTHSTELPVIPLSAKTGEGIPALKQVIKQTVGFVEENENTFIARRRHLTALKNAKQFLENALQRIQSELSLDCVAEEFRLSHQALGEITGSFSSDDLLGEIFSSFCIGK